MLDGLNEFTLALIEVFVFWFRKLKEFKLSLTKVFKLLNQGSFQGIEVENQSISYQIFII